MTFFSVIMIEFGIMIHMFGIYFEITIKDIPIILTTGLLGPFYGIIVVYITFIYKAFSDTRYLYMMFVFMMAVLLTSHMTSHRWYKSIKKTLLSAIYLSLILGSMWWFLVNRIGDVSIIDTEFLLYIIYFLGILPEAVISSFVLYFIFTKTNDKIRSYIPAGKFYLDNNYEKIQQAKLTSRLTIMITLDCVIMSIFAAFASDFLIPTLAPDVLTFPSSSGTIGISDVFSPYEYGVVDAPQLVSLDEGASFNLDAILTPVSYSVFVYNKHGIAYNIRLIMLIMNIGIPIGLITQYYAQKNIARPIVLLRNAASAFNYENIDEKTLLENVQKIDNINISVGNEIDELHNSIKHAAHFMVNYIDFIRQEQKLESELQIARQANLAKNSFLSNMSHELRTPINVILGMDEMILREYGDDENIRLYAGGIQMSGKTLLSLVNDILDFSRIESGKMEIIPVQYDLSSLVSDLYNMISVKAQEKQLLLDIIVDEKTPHLLYGDDIRLKQCILNLLTNAVKYTEKGKVTLSIGYENIDEKNILLKVKVTDTGIGMKKEEIDKLFTPFERLDERRNRTIEGTGLGMSIVSNLLSMMNSKLIVESEYGKGSTFSFAVIQHVIDSAAVGNVAKSFREFLSHKGKYHDAFTAPSAKILVVDDTSMNLTVMKSLLKSSLLNIDTATSGAECIEKVRENKYDVLFIDHRMPGMDGIETLHRLKNMGSLNKSIDAPCIALTANAILGAREEYIGEGFDDYISKPVDVDKLNDILIKYIDDDKIHLYGSDEYTFDKKNSINANATSDSGDDDECFKNTTDELERFGKFVGLDIKEAIKNCQSPEILKSVIRDFWTGMNEKGELIEKYAKERDYENYTIQVHSLKSSARLIGAMKLSKDAEYLENCGSEKNAEEIDSKTPLLLALFYSYRDKLGAIFLEEDKDRENLPLIDKDTFNQYMSGIIELAEAFDFDNAESAYNEMIGTYSIEESEKELVSEVGKKLRLVDRDGILEAKEKYNF